MCTTDRGETPIETEESSGKREKKVEKYQELSFDSVRFPVFRNVRTLFFIRTIKIRIDHNIFPIEDSFEISLLLFV